MIRPEIAFCDFFDIRFILHLPIDQHVTVFYLYSVAANANDTFHIKSLACGIVGIFKNHHISPLGIGKPVAGAQGKDSVPCHDGIFHGACRHCGIDDKHRIHHKSQQHCQDDGLDPTENFFFQFVSAPYFRKPLMICASASFSVSPNVISFMS